MAENKAEMRQAIRTPFAVVESYNTIRANLLFLLSQYKGETVAVSSACAGEGKSTTALNIAVSFSQLGKRALIIDADLRKPTLHKKLHVDNNKGLSNILAGFCEFDDAVCKINPNLEVLTAGAIPPNPSELIASQAFDALMDNLKEIYDYIIIDTPPVNIVSDALLIGPRTDGILLVVKSDYTLHEDFKAAVSSIEFANIRILGTVINAVDQKKNAKYKYKSKYRRYYRYKNYSDSTYINK